jgi:hypothetical protein
MAQAAYQSVQTANGQGNLAITKPTSLAVGDLMVAQIYIYTPGSIIPPTGWTLIKDTAGISSTGEMASYWKIADAGDVAATSFTFGIPTGANQQATGAISRWLVPAGTIVDQSNGSSAGNTSSPSTSGITPTKSTSTLVILVGNNYDSGARTTSGYGVATSNPSSWTEAYEDSHSITVSTLSIALGYASRSILTATGNASATLSGAPQGSHIHIFNIVPPVLSPLQFGGAFNRPVVPILIPSSISGTFALGAADASGVSPAWRNEGKSDASWFNEPKS